MIDYVMDCMQAPVALVSFLTVSSGVLPQSVILYYTTRSTSAHVRVTADHHGHVHGRKGAPGEKELRPQKLSGAPAKTLG